MKININKNLLVNFTVKNQAITEIFKVLSSENRNRHSYRSRSNTVSFKFIIEMVVGNICITNKMNNESYVANATVCCV